MSCIKFPSSKAELSKVSNKENTNDNSIKYSQLIKIADQEFGQDKWSHAITNQTLDFIDYTTSKYQAGCVSIVRVQLRDGTFHEGMGYNNSEGSSKGSAIQKARSISYKDAFKRALVSFGSNIASKINMLSIQTSNPESLENVQNTVFQTKANVLNVPTFDTAPLIEDTPMSQTDAMMDKVDLDQLLNKDEKLTIKPRAAKLPVLYPKDTLNLDNKDNELNTVNALKKDTKPEISKTTVLAAISDEDIRLERKRKQRELQEEFKKKEESKKKQNDNGIKQLPNPRY